VQVEEEKKKSRESVNRKGELGAGVRILLFSGTCWGEKGSAIHKRNENLCCLRRKQGEKSSENVRSGGGEVNQILSTRMNLSAGSQRFAAFPSA
jgi:hypothetical protein